MACEPTVRLWDAGVTKPAVSPLGEVAQASQIRLSPKQ